MPQPGLCTLPPPPPLHDPTRWTIDDAIGAYAHAMPRADEATRVATFGALTRIFDAVRTREDLVRPSLVGRAMLVFPIERRRLVLSLLASFFTFLYRAGLLDGLELGRLELAIERARRTLGLRPRLVARPKPRPGERVDPELLRLALIADELQWWRREVRDRLDLASLASLVAHLARHDGIPVRLEALDPARWSDELRASGLAPSEAKRRLRVVDAWLAARRPSVQSAADVVALPNEGTRRERRSPLASAGGGGTLPP
ncbi:MAG: hypothetical protein H6723_07625 [Sandaracinus sp.]|nr:hypothetical protein [Sandaracinus sp.]